MESARRTKSMLPTKEFRAIETSPGQKAPFQTDAKTTLRFACIVVQLEQAGQRPRPLAGDIHVTRVCSDFEEQRDEGGGIGNALVAEVNLKLREGINEPQPIVLHGVLDLFEIELLSGEHFKDFGELSCCRVARVVEGGLVVFFATVIAEALFPKVGYFSVPVKGHASEILQPGGKIENSPSQMHGQAKDPGPRLFRHAANFILSRAVFSGLDPDILGRAARKNFGVGNGGGRLRGLV